MTSPPKPLSSASPVKVIRKPLSLGARRVQSDVHPAGTAHAPSKTPMVQARTVSPTSLFVDTPVEAVAGSTKGLTVQHEVSTINDNVPAAAVLAALFSGKDVVINRHTYRVVHKGQILDGSPCCYSGVYVRTEGRPSFSFSTFTAGVFMDFITRNYEVCEIVG